MSSRSLILLFLFSFFHICTLYAQDKCGAQQLREQLTLGNPQLTTKIEELRTAPVAALKPANLNTSPVPVIFHIIVTQQQLGQIGGEALLKSRIDSQIALLNRNFNAQNSDLSAVPEAFRGLTGNADIHFALAQTAPGGAATIGYEVKITDQKGFNLSGGGGSGFGFSSAKTLSSGGITGWDPTTYLNVWVINPLDNNIATTYLGLTVPESYTGPSTGIPVAEMGIMLHYKSLSNTSTSRTLTHEMGHFFGLWHVWGDDDGKCPGDGGKDDGIDDTPPQAGPIYDCPVFPKLDKCSPTGNGIMFMNFMDYSTDVCQHMFTIQQAARMDSYIMPGSVLYSLTQHPDILKPGSAATDNYTIAPNPAAGFINIVFGTAPAHLQQIDMINAMGQVVALIEAPTPQGYYPINTSNIGAGIYYLRLHFSTGVQVKKVVVQ